MNIWQLVWPREAPHPPLGEEDVHTWQINLTQNDELVNECWSSLSPDEKQKAAKYRFRKERIQFALTRGTLRNILGRYLNLAPSRINFSYNRFGKPSLKGVEYQLRFNVAHTDGRAFIALTRGREIGADIELMRNDLEVAKIAESFFSPEEMNTFYSLAADLRTAAFFSGWTRKEALLKALGNGFSLSPKKFTVPLAPGPTHFSLKTDNRRGSRYWVLIQLPREQNYIRALAVEGQIQSIRYPHPRIKRLGAKDYASCPQGIFIYITPDEEIMKGKFLTALCREDILTPSSTR